MAIAVYFNPQGLTLAQYEAVEKRLDEAGGAPAGRIHDSCFGEDGALMVFQIWESPEAFAAFGEVLMPILGEAGIDPGEPAVMPVHHLEQTAHP